MRLRLPRRGGLALLVVLAALGLAGPAHASSTQEAIFQDDPGLTSGSDQQVQNTMSTLPRLGVDRVRVSVLWRAIAPNTSSRTRPAFAAGGEADPASYPDGAWNAYDRVVNAGRRYGVAIYFTITGPAPLWATANPARGEPQTEPRPSDFRAFVTAVGRRYSGTYRDRSPEVAPPPQSGGGGLGGLLGGGSDPNPPAPAPTPGNVLPRVSFWSLYNEPNQPGWLRPQAKRVGGKMVPASPALYRSLQDAGYAGLATSGHGHDTILLAETAPRGSLGLGRTRPMRPLVFIRELYCVNRKFRPYTGNRAKARGCPPNRAGRKRFVRAHPGLFHSTAWAHHPYALEVPPQVRDRPRDQVTISTLPRLTRTLDHIFRRYRQRRRLKIWLTEYGYQTNPPDPFTGVSYRRQAAYINQAEEIAYRNRRVRSMAQFLLVDDKPNTSVPPSNPRYWGSTFQTGLVSLSGRSKPSLLAYQRPVNVTPTRVRGGRRIRVWGGLRPARNGHRLSVRVQFRRKGSHRWSTARRVSTRNRRGYVVAHLRARGRLRHTGYYRLLWTNPAGGKALASRAVYVKLAKRRR